MGVVAAHLKGTGLDADVWLAKGGTWSDGTISVWALGSTDSGVLWIVETEDKAAIKRGQSQACLDSAEREQARPKVKRIFHAGDLNNWYAKFLTDDNPDQQRYSFETEEVFNPIAHEKQFLGELKDIGNGYTLGGRQFIERFKVGLFVPMHFTTGFESSWRMKEFTDEKNISFWKITREGEAKKI